MNEEPPMSFRSTVMLINRKFLLLSFLLFAGCSLPLPEPSTKIFYVIRDVPEVVTKVDRHVPMVLRVRQAEAGHLLGSKKIVFGKNASTRGYYRYALWAETPPRRLTQLMERSIEQASLFQAVVDSDTGATADVELHTEMLEFYHQTDDAPGRAVVKIRSVLVDLRSREVLGKQEFHAAQDVESFDVEGATKGLERSLSLVLGDLVRWLGEVV